MEYRKPMIVANDDIAEVISAASGNASDDCYTTSAYIHQTPETGRGDFRIQVNAVHAAGDGHHSGQQVLELSFNQPVEYVWSNGSLKSGNGTSTIQIDYSYHNNGNDNVGLGDVIVTADQGLAVTDATLYCNHDCGQH